MVHFSYNSYNLTISQFFTILSLRSSIFIISFKKLNGPKSIFGSVRLFFQKKFFHRRVPPSIFWYFWTEWILKIPKWSPLSVFFGIVRLFLKKKSIKGSPIHQYFDILKSFWYFLALDMAPTWADPACFFFRLQSSNWSVHFLETILKPPKAPSPSKGPKQTECKGSPFQFLLFQGNLQNRTGLKSPPFDFFFGTVRLFSKIFCLQRVPLSFFTFFNVIYKSGRDWRVPILTFFGTVRLFFENF